MLVKVVCRSVCKGSSKSFFTIHPFGPYFSDCRYDFLTPVHLHYYGQFIIQNEKCISENVLHSIFVEEAVLLKLHIPQFFEYGLVSKDTD